MLQDRAFRDETLRFAAELLGQYMGWKGEVTTGGSLSGRAALKIGNSGAINILGSALGTQPSVLAQYGITRDNAEKVLADLNYALVSKA